MRVLPCGDRAILVEVDDLDQVLGLHAALQANPPDGVTELVPAARTLLVRYNPDRTDLHRLGEDVAQRPPNATDSSDRATVEIPVQYDGEDLADVAHLTGLDGDEVIRRHLTGDYTVAFCGFAPGFAYITGLDPQLHVPRLSTPRTTVPSGAVAIADEFTAVYPRPSPGGWRIIGRTTLPVWDLERENPALLPPGTRIKFVQAPGAGRS